VLDAGYFCAHHDVAWLVCLCVGNMWLIFIDRVAGEIIRLVASVCVCVPVCLSVGALLFEPFDL